MDYARKVSRRGSRVCNCGQLIEATKRCFDSKTSIEGAGCLYFDSSPPRHCPRSAVTPYFGRAYGY
jgi:hypothetical protein